MTDATKDKIKLSNNVIITIVFIFNKYKKK